TPKAKNAVIVLALWAGLCQWHKGIAKSIFNTVSGKKKLKFALDNIALLLISEGADMPCS
ncbi:hypothetical protein OAF63_02605, partial [Saprospiraceae bacterium]|nr:hypothetical protein [Saprospiraceae bacterium]